MTRLLLVIILILPMSLFAQINESEYIPKVVEGVNRVEVEYKWPYIKGIPPFIGIVGGYEGFKSSYYEMGLAFNFLRNDYMAIGGMAGIQLLHKRHFSENIQSYEAEIGWYNIICYGLNFNYNVSGDFNTFGIKPFIGLSLCNIQFSWGYNFFSNKKNGIYPLRHSNWQIKYVIPIIPFKGKETRYIDEFRSNYGRHLPDYENGDYIRSDIQLR